MARTFSVLCSSLCVCAHTNTARSDIAAALLVDDECFSDGDSTCALELAQLRAVQLPEVALAVAAGSADPDQSLGTDKYGHPSWLPSCRTIFLDVGSSLGVNVRKLFESNRYPGSSLLPYFTKYIGSQGWRRAAAEKSGLCALGLEPSPEHQAHLQRLQGAYSNQGWNVHFYPFAAWNADGSAAFTAAAKHPPQPGDEQMGGGHLTMGGGDDEAAQSVRTVDFARFLKSLPVAVDLMVIDIEGGEYEVLARLMQQNSLCQSSVKRALVEAHNWGDVTHWGKADAFVEGVHPRSYLAMAQHIAELKALGFCAPSNVTELSEFNDLMFTSDVDDWFGAKEKEDGVA